MPNSDAVILGFDYGLSRIGVAVGQTLTSQARPLSVLLARDGIPNWNEVAELLGQWQPQQLVVGLPLTEDGGAQAITPRAQKFANRLHGRFGLPVAMEDERFSSVEASDILRGQRQAGRKRRVNKTELDATAAALILEQWLQHQ